ncbi:hypothetical protein C9374_000061 [Naegleria lovaniensis]|uniref:Uncharacterized protein n=1 Tax=Naegleria lovaniensis TaxID=51637 RepID=A0AA88GX04_NAELO|nr:uncharacterized protein C9374_000061 [Naegleria lovaniensis]KAG2388622.1 hypothetical protein C9374_000061 [Naegleria lovaniensis]
MVFGWFQLFRAKKFSASETTNEESNHFLTNNSKSSHVLPSSSSNGFDSSRFWFWNRLMSSNYHLFQSPLRRLIVHAQEEESSSHELQQQQHNSQGPTSEEMFQQFLKHTQSKHQTEQRGKPKIETSKEEPIEDRLTTLALEDLEDDEIFARVQRKYHLKNIYKLMNSWAKCSSMPREPLDSHPFVTDPKTLETMQLACHVSGMVDAEEYFTLTHRCLPTTDTINLVSGHKAFSSNILNKDEALETVTQCRDCVEGTDPHTQEMKQIYFETKDLIEEKNSLRIFLPKVSALLNLVSETEGLSEGPQIEAREKFCVNQHKDSNRSIASKIHWAQLKIFQNEFSEMRSCLHSASNDTEKCKFETTNYVLQSRAVACGKEMAYCLDNFSTIANKLEDYQRRHTKTGVLIGFGKTEEKSKATTIHFPKEKETATIEETKDEDDDYVFGSYNYDNLDEEEEAVFVGKNDHTEDDEHDAYFLNQSALTNANTKSNTNSKSITSSLSSTNFLLRGSQKRKQVDDSLEGSTYASSRTVSGSSEVDMNANTTDFTNMKLEDRDQVLTSTMERFTKCMTLYQPVTNCVKRVEKALQQNLAKVQRRNGKKKKRRFKQREKSYAEKLYDFDTSKEE